MQNMGVPTLPLFYCDRKLDRAIALHPDLVVLTLNAADLQQGVGLEQASKRVDPHAVARRPTIALGLQNYIVMSRALLVAEHFRFSDRAVYLRTYLLYGDKADYLRVPFTSRWQKRFSDLGVVVSDMAVRLKREHIAFLVMVAPSQAEATLLHTHPFPPHTDPFAFGNAVHELASQAGAGYVDALAEFQRQPGSEYLFYVANGHINPAGQSLLSQALVRKCMDGTIPVFLPPRNGP